MSTQRRLWLGNILLLLFAAAVAACTPGPSATLPPPAPLAAAASPTPTTLPPQPTATPTGLRLFRENPPPAAALPLSGPLTFTFNRPLDADSIRRAFRLTDAEGQPITVALTLPDPRTVQITLPHPLQPESTYTATFSTDLRAADGLSLSAPIRRTYTTEAALAVSRVFPAEDSRDVPVNSDITVVFNKPMVPLTSREDAAAAPLPLRMTPEVAGEGRWVSTAIYVFHPTHGLASNTTYTVTLPAGIATESGETLAQGITWQFQTRAPTIEQVTSDNQWLYETEVASFIRLDAALTITFSQPMDKAATEAAIRLETALPGRVPPLRLRWNDDATQLTIVPKALYSTEARYTLTITPNARAQDGGFLPRAYHYTFETVGQPRVLDLPPHIQQSYSPWVTVSFNTYLPEDDLARYVQISPAPENLSVTAYNRYLQISSLTPGTTYTITLLPGLPDIYGHTLQQPYTFRITTAHMEPQADLLLPHPAAMVRADGPQTLWLRYANLSTLTLSLYAVADEAVLQSLTTYEQCPSTGTLIGTWRPDEVPTAARDAIHYLAFTLQDIAGTAPLAPGAYCLRMAWTPRPDYASDENALVLLVTDNITFQTSPGNALAWVTDLAHGAPQSGLPVQLFTVEEDGTPPRLTTTAPQTTDGDGVAAWEGLARAPRFALLHTADRFALTDASWGSDEDSPYTAYYQALTYEKPGSLTALLYTDRPLYRPGQQIFFKGVVREDHDLHYRLPTLTNVWVDLYHEDKRIAHQRVPLSAFGTFYGTVTLAPEAPVGNYTWRIASGEGNDAEILGWGSTRVAAYHKPVFEVRLKPQNADLMPGSRTTVDLNAAYYAGDAVPRAAVTWHIDPRRYTFQPPENFAAYTFWPTGEDLWYWWQPPQETPPGLKPQHGETTTDAQGHAVIPLQAPSAADAEGDIQLTVWAEVTDGGGNTAEGHTAVIVRQSDVYVGLKTDRWVGIVGEPTTIDLVVLDTQGRPLPHHTLRLEIAEERWHSVQTRDASGILRWESNLEITPVTAYEDLTTDAQGRAQVTFSAEHSGTYRLTAITHDDQGRPRTASLRLWVAGKEALLWAQEAHTLPIIPDAQNYHPGEAAHLLVPQPFGQPSYALLTLARGHIFSHRVVMLDQANTMLEVPLTSDMAPVVYASVVTVRAAGDDHPPDYRAGTVRLPVALDAQRLRVTITPDRDHLSPGETVRLTVETRDSQGQPVPAEVSLAMVDKAILALAPDDFSLLARLYPDRSLQVATALGLTGDVESYNARLARTMPEGEGMGSGGGKGADLGGVLTVRENFRDTAYWKANVVTGDDGRAEVTVTLPDNMTTWVVRARAITTDTRVGTATAEITVNRPFFVRLHTPAFFTGGDTPTLIAVIHNATEQPLHATVRLSRAEGLQLQSPSSQEVDIPARGQATVQWRAVVPLDATRVDLQVEATAANYRDASRPTLTTLPDGGIPVYQFTTAEVVGTSGMLTAASEITETIQPPKNAPHVSLHLEVSPSLAAEMTQAMKPLDPPTSKCTWGWASNLLSNVALARAYQAQGQALPSTLEDAIQRGIQALEALQTYGGGWPWCPGGDPDTMPTTYAALALTEAQAGGFATDAATHSQALDYLYRVLQQPPRDLPPNQIALMLDVVSHDQATPAATSAAYWLAERGEEEGMGNDAWALLLRAALRLHMEDAFTRPLVQRLENAVIRSAAGAYWDSTRGSLWGWGSDTATTALATDALLHADPQATFLPGAIRWLMQRRGAQYWGGDTTNALVLFTLADWVKSTHEAHPDYQAAVLLDGAPAATFAMHGAQAAARPFQWDESALSPTTAHTLTLRRGPGEGVLYYHAYLETTLPADQVRARADGIALARAYYRVDDLQTPAQTFPVGSIVQVRLTLVAPHDLRHVTLTDYLPAGLEPLDPNRNWTPEGNLPFSSNDFWRYGWGGWYFYHREAYDERVTFSADILPAGVYTLTYYARAASPGDYQARPAVAAETLFPDVRGRSAGAQIHITAAR